MKTVGQAPVYFKLSEFEPSMTDWGHTGYLSVSPQGDFSIDAHTDLHIFFTPRKGTTFEQVEQIADELNRLFEKVYFNVLPKSPRP